MVHDKLRSEDKNTYSNTSRVKTSEIQATTAGLVTLNLCICWTVGLRVSVSCF